MTFITSFEILFLCSFSMQDCFCMVATVTVGGIASMVGTVSMVSTVSSVTMVPTILSGTINNLYLIYL